MTQADGKASGNSIIEWSKARDAAMSYCQEKRDEHCFDGEGYYDMTKTAIYDLIGQKETTP